MKNTYSLREIVEETGLSKLVLHAWERRYGAIVPERTETGRRIYRHEDLLRLQLLKGCVDNGQRIGSIIHLSNDDLQRVLLGQKRLQDLGDVIAAIELMDGDGLDRMLGTRFMTLGPVEFCREVVLPLMSEIGRLWAEGKMSIASEHLVTAAIRALLSGAFKLMPAPRGAHRMVFSTVEGELHEIGALVAAIIARDQGVHATYLGSQLPAEALAEAVTKTGSTIVCLSGAVKRNRNAISQIKTIRAALPANVALWLGGAAFADLPPITGVTYFDRIDLFETATAALQAD
ncbi:MerR family transcriptional regulator [Allorhizobium taibaishanense]|uniref:DNA-binding transcriptional MerR regulator n=1 Tax=Allorhizobium taibaishanense TaxID=887144 RepID=A0A1Q9A3G9_9HYPH|nr:MerR family transcriptional regulator [Allorhizobium taibaishanense]MBB4006073.1 DNA-binding transcriptional MerR regulator [Allorhizobium taibaishanense]OLP49082.1 hypothetical protein BJF91_18450 [Allorhizobium taibaishanense]